MPIPHVNAGPSSEKYARANHPTPGLNGQGDCETPDPASSVTDRLNNLLATGGQGYTLRLCPDSQYIITAPIKFTAPNQEISTYGYPTDDSRGVLVVMGSVNTSPPHATAVDGTCATCNGVKLRNVQVNGTRNGSPPVPNAAANIEFGGANSDQLIEYVHSFNPRGWSCLHVSEGPLTCNNATVQNNDIGPCGTDSFQEWADGVSMSCRNSVVRNNLIGGATDGGIVLFGAPGTLVENNTIWAANYTLLGGINMVDVDPFGGNYTGTVVRNNTIYGGFASDIEDETRQTKGENDDAAIVKIGIAVGPRTWFGNKFYQNVSANGSVLDNRLSGAFGYGIAVTSAVNFEFSGNEIFGNTTFIGSRGPNCTKEDTLPNPLPFVIDRNNTKSVNVQPDFQGIPDGDALTCLVPPDGGDYWPFRGGPGPGDPGLSGSQSMEGGGSHLSGGAVAGVVVGVIVGVVAIAIGAWYIRKWALNNRSPPQGMSTSETRQHMLRDN